MSLQRLKFAEARGARIQCSGTQQPHRWGLKGPNGFWPDLLYRIHPDDEHLQYGPVSQAFRDMALFKDIAELHEEVELFMDLAGSNWVLEADSSDPVLVDWTRLFFAEYLADMGL